MTAPHEMEMLAAEHGELASSASKDPYFSRAVGKAFEILQALTAAGAPLTLNEISSSIALTKSSAFRLLYTLEALHEVERDEQGHYLRTQGSLQVGGGDRLPQHLLEAAAIPMRKLHMRFHETISLSVLRERHIEVLDVLDSPQLIRMSNVVGRILPPHASSMGKAITAFQEPDLRAILLKSYGFTQFTEQTLIDERLLEDSFARIRETGISYDDEENTPGGFCVGVPIFWPGRQVKAALSLSMPKARLPQNAAAREAIPGALEAAASEIASALS